jgi:hypothetical protein
MIAAKAADAERLRLQRIAADEEAAAALEAADREAKKKARASHRKKILAAAAKGFDDLIAAANEETGTALTEPSGEFLVAAILDEKIPNVEIKF